MNLKLPGLFLLVINISYSSSSCACSIFSAKDKIGNVWIGNNEDAAFVYSPFHEYSLFSVQDPRLISFEVSTQIAANKPIKAKFTRIYTSFYN